MFELFFSFFNPQWHLDNKMLLEIASKEIIRSTTQKTHLQYLQRRYCPEKLILEINGSPKSIFIYSNDGHCIPNYHYISDRAYTTPDLMHNNKQSDHLLGIVIGNGYILSMLPDIDADDILLIDIEPTVHYFILAVRDMILQTNIDENFEHVKRNLVHQIVMLETAINRHIAKNNHDKQLSISDEMKSLGSRHFLANVTQFNRCKIALQTKELLPIKMDVFDKEKMSYLADLIQQAACRISFINLTNVAEYDDGVILCSNITQLPFAEKYSIISTEIIKRKQCIINTELVDFVKTFSDTNSSNFSHFLRL